MIADEVSVCYWQRGLWRCADSASMPCCHSVSACRAPLDTLYRSFLYRSPVPLLLQTSAVGEEYQQKLQSFVDELKSLPVAVQTAAANEQHYEVCAKNGSMLAD